MTMPPEPLPAMSTPTSPTTARPHPTPPAAPAPSTTPPGACVPPVPQPPPCGLPTSMPGPDPLRSTTRSLRNAGDDSGTSTQGLHPCGRTRTPGWRGPSGPRVGVPGPVAGSVGTSVTKLAAGVVQGTGGPAEVGRGGAMLSEVTVEVAGDLVGDGIAHRPEGSDDVLVASGAEGAGDVDGLI